MSAERMRDRIIALTAVVQTAKLVQGIAETGQINSSELETMLNSLIIDNADSTEALYGDISQLKTGIGELNSQLSKKKDQKEVVVLRYVIGLLHLERQLQKQPEMMDLINREIEQVPQQIEYFDTILAPQVIARFADIYQRTISELTPRIQVYGEAGFLQQPDNINKVRALLLAGIRAAIVWQQKGGKRWHFLFQGKKILHTAQELQSAG